MKNDANTVTLSCYAMATAFAIQLSGPQSEEYLNGVGKEALDEIAMWESLLSFYRPTSDIGDMNQHAAAQPTTVDPRVFNLLSHAVSIAKETNGAFDITVAPLLRCWGFTGEGGRLPTEEEVDAARALVGVEHLRLNQENFAVEFDANGVMVDLGAIGKGFAIDKAAEIVRDFEVPSAILHGGTSTVFGIGRPAEGDSWIVAIQRPGGEEGDYAAFASLRDCALSVSAPHGKWFEAGGRRYGHVIDPVTGYPAGDCLLAAVIMESATESDAFSTALLARGEEWIPQLLALRPNASALVVTESADGPPGSLKVTMAGPGFTAGAPAKSS